MIESLILCRSVDGRFEAQLVEKDLLVEGVSGNWERWLFSPELSLPSPNAPLTMGAYLGRLDDSTSEGLRTALLYDGGRTKARKRYGEWLERWISHERGLWFQEHPVAE